MTNDRPLLVRNGLTFVQDPHGRPTSYSAAVRVGDLIYTAGQIGADVGGPSVTTGEQVRTALRLVISAVEAAGGGLETIVKVNAYLADLNDFALYDQIYRDMIDLDPKPARTTVQVASLPAPLRIEVDAVASVRVIEGTESPCR